MSNIFIDIDVNEFYRLLNYYKDIYNITILKEKKVLYKKSIIPFFKKFIKQIQVYYFDFYKNDFKYGVSLIFVEEKNTKNIIYKYSISISIDNYTINLEDLRNKYIEIKI